MGMYDTLIEEYSGQFGQGRSVEDIVDWVEGLPPMPDVVTRALRLVDDFNTTAEDLADVIKRDPALASPILRSANSAGHGQKQQVTTLDQAIMVVGMGQTKTVLVAAALRRWNGKIGPVERLVWEKSLGTAAAAYCLCEQLRKPYRDELYLTGLLHNLGQIVLLSHKEVGALYPGVLKRMLDLGEDFSTAEREVIGFSHPLVGALVARKWGFPMGTCQAILHYTDPFEGMEGKEDEKFAVLKLASGLALHLGLGRPEGYAVDVTEEMGTLAPLIGFDETNFAEDIKSVMEKTEARFASEMSAHSS